MSSIQYRFFVLELAFVLFDVQVFKGQLDDQSYAANMLSFYNFLAYFML